MKSKSPGRGSSSAIPTATTPRPWRCAIGWSHAAGTISSSTSIRSAALSRVSAGSIASKRAPSAARPVLFVLSRAWLDSRYCTAEFWEARKQERPLFAVVIDDTAVDQVPAEMRGSGSSPSSPGLSLRDFRGAAHRQGPAGGAPRPPTLVVPVDHAEELFTTIRGDRAPRSQCRRGQQSRPVTITRRGRPTLRPTSRRPRRFICPWGRVPEKVHLRDAHRNADRRLRRLHGLTPTSAARSATQPALH